MKTKRFDRLIKRLATGEATDAERRELDALCANDQARLEEVRQTEAIIATAHAGTVEGPGDFQWAAFTTRLKATVESERPQPYGRLKTWVMGLGLSTAFAPRRLAYAASSVATVAIALVLALIVFRSNEPPETVIAGTLPEVEWTIEQINESYPVASDARMLPRDEVLTLQQEFLVEIEAVREVIEQGPSFGDDLMSDEEYIFG